MNVASFNLCRELYKLSGWNDSFFDYMYRDHVITRHIEGTALDGIPAYNLGYLLRKLPNGQRIVKSHKDYYVVNSIDGLTDVNSECSTPEDALTEFAIYLFKKGILVKE